MEDELALALVRFTAELAWPNASPEITETEVPEQRFCSRITDQSRSPKRTCLQLQSCLTNWQRLMTVRDALNSALDEGMSADPSVFLMGEEVGEYRGAHKVTKSLLDKYGPDRVLDTPIIEAGFIGIGVGTAYQGLRPVVELMAFNFLMQLFLQNARIFGHIRFSALM